MHALVEDEYTFMHYILRSGTKTKARASAVRADLYFRYDNEVYVI